ncbi:glycosyl transferase, family 9 [Thioalkalivibrio nitratireducens DSM 14787]|uniref:Glycosyl transferase, family 9 n=1 Tax=Thioalkalivibrio nitratireducens (strain DSM 14787 / UNIQEM 213 / ALEN2) TaxID=1255043 RepID=L0DZE3_THIND|nr:glycosyl transferase, family 9 [Thioalkalivibrio nitratireducens DSM 14787]
MPASLCIFRLSAIGDTTHVLPILRTVQRRWPDTAITWVVGRTEAGLVGDIPDVTFRVLDKREGIRRCRARLRAEETGRVHDVILQMQSSLRASLIATSLRGHRRIGFDRARAVNGQWLFTSERIAARSREHVLDAYFGFLERAGLAARELAWGIPLPDDALAFAARELPADRPLLAISACSSLRLHNYRDWPAERYVAVADHAAARGFRVVLTGGPSARERAYADAIVAGARVRPVDLVGQTSLKQLAAVLARCAGLIGPDSGPVHIASALDVPVIGLYATSNPQRTGPYRHREFVVDRYPDAVRRFLGREPDTLRWGTRVRHPRAMELITVADVCERIDRLAV